MLVGGAVVAVVEVVAQPHPGLGLGDQLEVGQELGGAVTDVGVGLLLRDTLA